MNQNSLSNSGDVTSWHADDVSTMSEVDVDAVLEAKPSPHVLCIDQSLEILDIYGSMLHDEHVHVTMSTLLLSLDQINRLQPDLVLIDVAFDRHVAGAELIERLVADENTRKTTVICCTVATERDLPPLPGSVPVIFKPFDLDELLRAILHALGVEKHHSQQ